MIFKDWINKNVKTETLGTETALKIKTCCRKQKQKSLSSIDFLWTPNVTEVKLNEKTLYWMSERYYLT